MSVKITYDTMKNKLQHSLCFSNCARSPSDKKTKEITIKMQQQNYFSQILLYDILIVYNSVRSQ